MPTDIGRWLLRSSGAHCDRELPVEVQHPTAIRSWRGGEEEETAAEEGAESYNNPHLAGGESDKPIVMTG